MSKQDLPTGKHTLVDEGTEFKGTLTSLCPIVVMGKVEGDISGPVIQVTTTGVVAGNVKVKELRSAGELAGLVEADTVQISGKVRDKTVIRAKSLEVSLSVSHGAMEVVFGECELVIGDEPDKKAAIAAATAGPAITTPAVERPTTARAGSDAAHRAESIDELTKLGTALDTHTAEATASTKPADTDATASLTGPAASTANDAVRLDDESDGKRRRGTQPPPIG